MAYSCLIAVAIVETWQEAASGVPLNVHIPRLDGWWHYVPLGLLTIAGISWLFGQWGKHRPKELQGVSESQLATLGRSLLQPTPLAWDAKAITDDQRTLPQNLFAVKWTPQRVFTGTDPYIDFDIVFINASVFNLRVPRTISGKVKFRNQPLTFPPQLEKVFEMPSRKRTWIKIRQHVTPGMAQAMQNAINSDQAAAVDFSDVRIDFVGDVPGTASVTFAWIGPGSVSFKEITPIEN